MTDPLYKPMTALLLQIGIGDQPHTGKTYIGHLLAVYRLMAEEGCELEVCRAGMFHSVYGTEVFQGFKLPLERRSEVRAVIGARAERLAYLNCAMDRASFDASLDRTAAPYSMRDRLTGEELALDEDDFLDLCRIHLYDWLEQAARSSRGLGYRQAAYERMAERAGPAAKEAYNRFLASATQA